jgi:hypothetical protein
VDLLL